MKWRYPSRLFFCLPLILFPGKVPSLDQRPFLEICLRLAWWSKYLNNLLVNFWWHLCRLHDPRICLLGRTRYSQNQSQCFYKAVFTVEITIELTVATVRSVRDYTAAQPPRNVNRQPPVVCRLILIKLAMKRHRPADLSGMKLDELRCSDAAAAAEKCARHWIRRFTISAASYPSLDLTGTQRQKCEQKKQSQQDRTQTTRTT